MGNTDGVTAVGIGGTQTTGASFGQGANNGSNGPGGGGGFYGGKSANTYRGAGGGSGYVGELLEAETYGYDGTVSEEAQSYSAKQGNGYAKITYVGKHETPTITTVGNSLVFEKPTHYEVEITKSGYYNLEAWGAQGGTTTGKRGGFGSYTEGVAYLEAGTTLHIYVGGKGQNAYYNRQITTGGYNGGGNSSGGNNYMAAAGGGSGYVGELLEAETYGYDGTVSEEAQSYSAKQGNGYAKITYIGNRETPTITTVGNSLVFERPTHYEVEITKTGNYKLEAWGAQGGTATGKRGGYGSYSVGVANLKAGTTLHIYVGGKGQNTYYNRQETIGGYNGGGSGKGGTDYKAAAGGGATHIAARIGELSSLSLNIGDVLIVAGGGGGAGYYTGSYYGFGGDAGGIQGNKGTIGGNTDGNTSVGAGGTQTEATNSLLGLGKNGTSGAGGGSGYYGGTQSGAYRGAGGGSGYIGNSLLISSNGVTKHMICYGKDCKTSTDAGTLTNSVTVVSETPTADTAKIGNGYAKITLVS